MVKKKAEHPEVDFSSLEALRESILDRWQSRLAKEIPSTSFYRLNDPNVPTRIKRIIPSGLPSFDLISARTPLGRSGIPIGRQMEIFGPNGAGKTSLACLLAGAAQQRLGWNIIWNECENKLDPDRAQTLGLDTSKVLFNQPSCLEDAIDVIDKAMDDIPERNKLPPELKNFGTLIVHDSVAATPSRTEMEGTMEDNNHGVFQRKMSQAQRRITNRLSKRNITIIWLNQIRAKLNFGGKGGTETYGGNALKFYCAQRWNIWSQKVGEKGKEKGIMLHIENVKNQCGVQPFRRVDVYLDFKNGFDYLDSWKHAMQQLFIGEPVGNSILMKEGPAAGQKLSNMKLKTMFEENPQFFYDYEKLMKDHVGNYHIVDKKKGKGGSDEAAEGGE